MQTTERRGSTTRTEVSQSCCQAVILERRIADADNGTERLHYEDKGKSIMLSSSYSGAEDC